ncbi:MAG: gas vesicle protein GvpN [Leptolyngbyaceae cyanobacterium bins.59]|nr:gas vesicle protein GvpN [Leptolyngbyaceae cyanobacterium bins.59]
MTTILQARPRRFVSTPSVERIAARSLRYLQSGFPVHLRGPAGTGKTTLALHLADLLGRPIMLVFGDDEFKTSDLIGNQSGFTRKKVVDNFIHSVVKVEDELRQNWVDSRLTLACREGFTLVYDEFNRSRPEVNNVLLSALEEKLLVLPPNNNRSEYIRVHPQFRAILTSNPEEYCGVHSTQDALLDRLVTINIPEPDELTQQEILVQKIEIERDAALLITRLVKAFRIQVGLEKSSGLRAGLMIAKVCHEHEVTIKANDLDFRDVCGDVLLSRANLSLSEATTTLWRILDELTQAPLESEAIQLSATVIQEPSSGVEVEEQPALSVESPDEANVLMETEQGETEQEEHFQDGNNAQNPDRMLQYEQQICEYLQHRESARISEIEAALGLNRFQTVDAVRALGEQGILKQKGDRVYIVK